MAEVERAGGQAGATTMVGAVLSKDIHGCTNSNSTSRHFHKDHTTSSPTPRTAGEDRHTSSSEEERITSAHPAIGEDIRHTSSA